MASVRARTLFAKHGLTVTAVESVDLRIDRSCRGRLAIGSVKPIAVIVREPGRTYALDIAAQPIDMEQLELPDDFELE